MQKMVKSEDLWDLKRWVEATLDEIAYVDTPEAISVHRALEPVYWRLYTMLEGENYDI